MKTVRKMLKSAATLGYTFKVGSEDEVDYSGASVNHAISAINELEEAHVTVINERGHRCGAAFICPDLDDDEMIADALGWVNDWMDENIEY